MSTLRNPSDPVAFTGNITTDRRIVAAANRAYYAGGTRIMLGGAPCRVASPNPSTTLRATYQETGRALAHYGPGKGLSHADKVKRRAKLEKAERDAYARAVKVGNRTVAEALAERG